MSSPSYPLTMPTSTSKFKTSEWRIIRSVSVNASPFSMAQQTADLGGAVWQTTVTLPPMKRDEAGAWQSFFMQLHGRFGSFLLGDPDSKTIQGGCTSSTVAVNGAHSVGAYDIAIDGVNASTLVFKQGDYLQFGSGATQKLHMVVSDATSNSSGQVTVAIEPPLKTALTDNLAVTYENTKAVMRMDSNELGWSADEISVYGITFSCTEVI